MKPKISLYYIVQITGWLSYFFLYCLLNKMSGGDIPTKFYFGHLMEAILGFMMTQFIRRNVLQRHILEKKVAVQSVNVLMLTVSYALVYAVVYSILSIIFGLHSPNSTISFFNYFLLQWMYSFVLLLIWSLLYFLYHYVEKNNKDELDKVQLASTIKDLELNTIKAHVNPHFMFNALNSIRALVDENPERARMAITELSNILRSSMQADKKKTTTLREELSIVKDYLALERIRFEDRLNVDFDVEEDLLGQSIPPMTLQTLVENAIKHGISRSVEGGTIKVSASTIDTFWQIKVENTGKLDLSKEPKGFGIISTKDRLRLLYGEKASFVLQDLPGNKVVATMIIPLNS